MGGGAVHSKHFELSTLPMLCAAVWVPNLGLTQLPRDLLPHRSPS